MVKLFNLESYYSNLRTKNLGRPCIYLEQVDSTIDVASKQAANTIVVAKEQLKGRGQRSNIWHSPFGCAMASIRMNLKRHSYLANKLSFLQHILALSISTTLENLDNSRLGKNHIKLKWPNDIVHLNQDRNTKKILKLGGILVSSHQLSDIYELTLSFGLNVFNKEPTTCLSEILTINSNLGIDIVIAETINNLEQLTNDMDDSKFKTIKDSYIERCLQMDQIVHDESKGLVLVKTVDDNGYLIGEKQDESKQSCTITKIL